MGGGPAVGSAPPLSQPSLTAAARAAAAGPLCSPSILARDENSAPLAEAAESVLNMELPEEQPSAATAGKRRGAAAAVKPQTWATGGLLAEEEQGAGKGAGEATAAGPSTTKTRTTVIKAVRGGSKGSAAAMAAIAAGNDAPVASRAAIKRGRGLGEV
jgi:hypothetical protein